MSCTTEDLKNTLRTTLGALPYFVHHRQRLPARRSFSQKLASALPVDYYTVFCELERALAGELDFLAEAQAAMKARLRGGRFKNPTVAAHSAVHRNGGIRLQGTERCTVEGCVLDRLGGNGSPRKHIWCFLLRAS